MFQTHLRHSDTSSHVLRAKSPDSEFLRKPRVCKNVIGTISRRYATIILMENIKLSAFQREAGYKKLNRNRNLGNGLTVDAYNGIKDM